MDTFPAPLLLLPLLLPSAVKFVELFVDRSFRASDVFSVFKPLGKVVKRYALETAGFASIAFVTAVLLCHGTAHGFLPGDEKLWDEMNTTWPVLKTADSLLTLQAMIRIVVLLSLVCRAGRVTPMAQEPAALFLLASVCRMILFAISPIELYHYNGPMGGAVGVIVEAAAIPPLAYLSCGVSRRRGAIAMVVLAFLAACVASCNRFSLAESTNAHMDTLFSLVQLFDFLAAAALLLRTVQCRDDLKMPIASSSFAYVVLPLQQLLPAYFFVMIINEPFDAPPELVRSGYPFQMMWLLCAAQLVMYAIAGVYHFAYITDELPRKAHMDVPFTWDV